MFGFKVTKLEGEVEELKEKKEGLEKDKKQLTEEVERLKLKKKLEDEDIKHMVKINEERLNIEHEKKVIESEKIADERVAQVKDDYRDKVEANLEVQVTNMKEMYGEILKRLPDVNVRLKGELK